MMTAEAIAAALGGQRSGAGWIARCPAHDDRSPSLSISVADDGRPLVKCFAGCEQSVVIDVLRARGLWQGGFFLSPCFRPLRFRADHRDRVEKARALWNRSLPAEGTLVASYLSSRGIVGPIPASIRFMASARHASSGLAFPCMISAVTRWPMEEVVAIHRTFILLDGSGKAPVSPNKMALGPVSGAAVRLAQADTSMAIAEGLETALSVQQATGLPTWAALSAGGIEALILPEPPLATDIIIFADNDCRGRRAAEVAAERWNLERRRVRIALPPIAGQDFNDLLLSASADRRGR